MNSTTRIFVFLVTIQIGCTYQPKDSSIVKSVDQQITPENNNIIISGGCNFNNVVEKQSIILNEPSVREINQIENILKYTGLPQNFEVFSANISNAIAVTINGKRIIVYDKRLFLALDQNSKTYWSSMSILAHEIGHHLSGHTLTGEGSNFKAELEADKFSGFILQKMGASLADAQYAILLLASETYSSTHPLKSARLQAIQSGWDEANKLRFNAAIPPPPEDILDRGGVDEFNTENLVNSPSYRYLKAQSGNGFGISDKMDGIIVDLSDENYSILVTNTTEDDNLYLKKTILVELHDPWESFAPLGRAQYSWLSEVLVPGRRLQFAFLSEGTADVKHFVYIKSLKGSSY